MTFRPSVSLSPAYAFYNGKTTVLPPSRSKDGSQSSDSWCMSVSGVRPELFENMVCIGRDIPIGSGKYAGIVSSLYVAPSGSVLAVEEFSKNAEVSGASLHNHSSDLSSWSFSRLDDIAADYYFSQFGQAFGLVDIMARLGHMTFSDVTQFSADVERCLKTCSFLLLLVPKSDLP